LTSGSTGEKHERRVAEVMHAGVFTCRPDTPISEVARRMVEYDASALVVTDDQGYLLGVVTRTDLVTLRAFDEYWIEMSAEHAMVRQVITIPPQATIREASRLIVDKKIHRLVVVQQEGERLRPVGILSQTDIVRDMAQS
jgi:CBS domain-containing protein